MLPFSSRSIAVRRPKVLKEVVEIYCHCRLPYVQAEGWCNVIYAKSGFIVIVCMYPQASSEDPLVDTVPLYACVNSLSTMSQFETNMHAPSV